MRLRLVFPGSCRRCLSSAVRTLPEHSPSATGGLLSFPVRERSRTSLCQGKGEAGRRSGCRARQGAAPGPLGCQGANARLGANGRSACSGSVLFRGWRWRYCRRACALARGSRSPWVSCGSADPAADRHRVDGQQRVAVVGRLASRMPLAQYHGSIGGFVMAESEAFHGAERRTP